MKRAIVIIILAAVPVYADVVHLRGGGRISGEIVKQTEDTVTVDIGGGYMQAHMSSVVRIEKTTSPLQEYRAKAAEIPADDTEAWRKIARWAKRQALSSQAAEAWANVLAILPDDAEANRALGRVWFDGRWVSEEDAYRAQGYINFEHQWMKPAERDQILASRQAQEAADEKANQAAIKAIEGQQAAEKQHEEAERDADKDRFNHLPELGDPVHPVNHWGWGHGPAYWPAPAGGGK